MRYYFTLVLCVIDTGARVAADRSTWVYEKEEEEKKNEYGTTVHGSAVKLSFLICIMYLCTIQFVIYVYGVGQGGHEVI